jgi:nucleoside-diphosphate-sugar epimerase
MGSMRSPTALTYQSADDGVISTRRLVEVLADGMGVQPRLINVPRWLAVGGATLLGKVAMARRLFDDLEVDDSDFRRDFGWKPRIGLEDGLRLMAEDFARRIRDERIQPMGLY